MVFAPQPKIQMKLAIGDKVMFGRAKGEKTLGRVTKVNRKTVKVMQLERRGCKRDYPVGTIWTVPITLCTPVAEDVVPNTGGMSWDNYAEARNELGSNFVNILDPSTFSYRPGDKVTFRAKGRKVIGHVKRVNRKTISVEPVGGNGEYWRVPPARLQPA